MSHETPKLDASPREKVGSVYAQRLRKQGRLPAVIYGHKLDPVAISVDEKEILTHLRHGTHVLTIEVQGAKPETCLVKELQFGYLGDNVIHVDFARVDLEEEVEVAVHLNFVGEPHAAQQAGAILSHDVTSLDVRCRVDAIPDEIKVDLNRMGEGTVLTIADITLPPGVTAVDDPETPVAHVAYVKKEEEAVVGEEAEVEAAATEPEVITEAKEEAEEQEGESSS
jgi:large subunit ribosomal protein L25